MSNTATEADAEARPRRLFLIDAANLAYRSHYAFIRAPLTNAAGMNTSAVFGFTQTVLGILNEEHPDLVAVCWDPPGRTERHQEFEAYKAQRKPMPSELRESLPWIRRVVCALGLRQVEVAGVEADDVIGTLAKAAEARGDHAVIVSTDKDFVQLIGPQIRCLNLRKGWRGRELTGAPEATKRWGVAPARVRDVLALMGDASDNVPGVPGVGAKTASALVREHGSVAEIYADLSAIKKKGVRRRLEEHRELAELSLQLVTIRTDVPLETDLDDLVPGPVAAQDLRAMFEELEFQRLLQKVPVQAGSPPFGEQETQAAPAAPTLPALERLDSLAAVRSLVRALSDAPRVGLELCVQGAHAEGRIAGLALALPDRTVYVPTATAGLPGTLFAKPCLDRERLARVLEILRPWLEDEGAAKVGHDLKRACLALAARGVELRGIAFDTMLASYVVDPSRRTHDLGGLASRRLHLVLGAPGAERVEDAVADAEAHAVAARAAAALVLVEPLEATLSALEVQQVYRSVELPLVPILARMERVGVHVDLGMLASLSREFEERLEEHQAAIHAIAGRAFNVDSPKQLREVLYEELELHRKLGVRVKRTKTGLSTDQSVLEQLREHPVVDRILAYRRLRKLKGTYLDALPSLADAEGRLHTTFNQAVTATGRLSSSDPNLQNIPVRTPEGRRIRAAFTAGDPSFRLLSADYSQVELRILAHLSGDETLIAAFRRDLDVHRATAARVFGVSEDEVTPELRARAKGVNFGIIYGMGAQRLGRDTGMGVPEARAFIDHYFEQLPGVKAYLDRTVELATERGYVQTLLGRRRVLTDLRSENPRLRSRARSMAVNTPIQGSAADLIKVAMVRLERALRAAGSRAQMLLQVHDELVLRCPLDELDAVSALVRKEMEAVYPDLAVPLRVDLGHGRSWLEAH